MAATGFTLWTTSGDSERDALIPVLEAAGLALDSHSYSYGSTSGHSVTISTSWPEAIESLGGAPATVAAGLTTLLARICEVSEASWGKLDVVSVIDFDPIIWLTFHRSDLELPLSEWEALILMPLEELQCDGPEASTVIAHRPDGWGRVDRAGGPE